MKRHRRLAEFGVADPAFDGGKIKRYLQIGPMGAALAMAGLLFLSTAADAQSSNSGTVSNSSSGRFWGTTGSTAIDSATMHALDGNAAGQVNAAKQGLLLNAGPGMSITAIGSQNIVSNTIIGDNNTANINATQTSTNTGSVTNSGTIIPR
jgi:hypothetical protein